MGGLARTSRPEDTENMANKRGMVGYWAEFGL